MKHDNLEHSRIQLGKSIRKATDGIEESLQGYINELVKLNTYTDPNDTTTDCVPTGKKQQLLDVVGELQESLVKVKKKGEKIRKLNEDICNI